VIGQVVVVFNGLEGRRFAEESEVVDWDGGGEESLYCYKTSLQSTQSPAPDTAKKGARQKYHQACPIPILELGPGKWFLELWSWLYIHNRDVFWPV
jgi:hypothetical protein